MGIWKILTKLRSIFLFLTVVFCMSFILFDIFSGDGNDLRKSTSFNYIYEPYPMTKQLLKSSSQFPKLNLIQYKSKLLVKPHVDQAIILIHGNYLVQNASLNLFSKMQQNNKYKRQLRLFSFQVDNHQKKFHQTNDNFENFISNIHLLLDYLISVQGIRKMTVIAIEFGGNAFLNYLSRVSLDIFPVLDKIIFVNVQYKRFRLYHSNYKEEYDQMLIKFNEPDRFVLMNQLKIISIQSKKINRKWPQSYTKLILMSNTAPKQFLHIDSRYIWSVYMLQQTPILFYFSPFVNLFASFLLTDYMFKMSIKQIDYFFRYKQQPQKQPVSTYKHQFALDCIDVHGNNFIDSRYFLKKGCWVFKFISNHNSGVVIESKSQVQLFTQKFIRIPPFLSDNIKTIYFLNNISTLNGMYLRNPTPDTVIVRFIKPTSLKSQQFNITISILKTSSQIVHFPDTPIRICPQVKLLFPITDSTCFVLQNPIILHNQMSKVMKVYVTAVVDISKQFFRSYINLHRNVVICYLFGLQMFNGNPYPMFGLQPIIMWFNIKKCTLQFIVIETLFALSIALSCYKAFGIVRFISKIFNFIGQTGFGMTCLPFVVFLFGTIAKLIQNQKSSFNQWLTLFPYLFFVARHYEIGTLYSIMIMLNSDHIFIQSISFFRYIPMQLLLLIGHYKNKNFVYSPWINRLNYTTLILMNIFIEDDLSIIQTILELHIFMLSGIHLLHMIHKK